MIGFFYFSEKKLAKYPLMPLAMFKNRSNNAAFLVGFAHGATFIAAEYHDHSPFIFVQRLLTPV